MRPSDTNVAGMDAGLGHSTDVRPGFPFLLLLLQQHHRKMLQGQRCFLWTRWPRRVEVTTQP